MVDFTLEVVTPDWGHEVDVDGDGDIEIATGSGRHQDTIHLSRSDLEFLLDLSKRHKTAFDAYKEADYDDATYTNVYESLAR